MQTHKIEITTWGIDDHPYPEAVFDWIRDTWHDLYDDHGDSANSLKRFWCHFDLRDTDYSVSLYGHSYAKGKTIVCDDRGELRGIPLWIHLHTTHRLIYTYGYTKLSNIFSADRPFTGHYMDNVLLEPVRKFYNHVTDISYQELMDQCMDAWVAAYVEDWRYLYTDDGLRDLCEVNDYQFTADGAFCPD